MSDALLRRIVVPIASEADAETTCTAIRAHLGDEPGDLHVVHVVEKGDGYIDKAPMEARREQAERIFEIARADLAGLDSNVHTDLRFGTSVLEEILAAADEVAATAIVFTDRPSTTLVDLLTGNLARRLVANTTTPVIALPRPDESA